MKDLFGFACTALSLFSVVNSTISIDAQWQTIIIDGLLNTFFELERKVIYYIQFDKFLNSLTRALLVIILNNIELEDNFKDLMRKVKYASISDEI